MANHLMSRSIFLHQREQNKAYLDVKVIVVQKNTKSNQNHPKNLFQIKIKNHCQKSDFKSKSKIINMISNHDFKSIDLKSFPGDWNMTFRMMST